MLATRIDRLLPADKRLLQTAAVIGPDVSVPLLHAITALPEATLHDSLGRLQAVEFLAETRAVPVLTYTFKHVLTQEVAYQSLLSRARQQIHQRIAQVVEAQFPAMAATQPAWVAQHYTEAGCTEPAIAYWQRAGQQALQRSANLEAAQHLTQGLALLATLPEAQARAQQELDLQMMLGHALMATKGIGAPDVAQVYARAHTLCGQVGETLQLFPVLWGLLRFYLQQGAFSTARALGEQLLTLAHRANDPALLLVAHVTLGSTLFHMGECALARTHLEQGLTHANVEEQQALALRYGLSPHVFGLAFVAWALWVLGFPDHALQRMQEACTLAQTLVHPYSGAFAHFYAARLHLFRGEGSAAQAQAEACVTLATAQEFPHLVALATIVRGTALATQGQREEGLTLLRQGAAALQASGGTLDLTIYTPSLAEVAGQVGRIAEGLEGLAKTLAVVAERGQDFMEVELYRSQGELLLRQDSPDMAQAEACFQQALAIARRQQAKSWELRAAMSLSRLWQRQSKRAEARALLAPIYDWFTEGFDTLDLQEAKALLEVL